MRVCRATICVLIVPCHARVNNCRFEMGNLDAQLYRNCVTVGRTVVLSRKRLTTPFRYYLSENRAYGYVESPPLY